MRPPNLFKLNNQVLQDFFIAFAPKDDPKIAIAVYVENAGFGATYAAPVASLMIEKYLTGKVTNAWSEQRILDLNLIDGDNTER